MPKLPKLEPLDYHTEDNEGNDVCFTVYSEDDVEARENEIKKRLRLIWLKDNPKDKDNLVEEILERMEGD